MSRVLVAMSGGVDSSVAAALLVQAGHDVTGVHLKLADQNYSNPSDGRVHGCCSVEAADDARRVAQVLDIPYYVWNLADAFREAVVDDFVSEYANGRTPNPCVRCNEKVKFGLVLRRGLTLGFDFVATGHYAIADHADAGSRLYRSVDDRKDQSYVLSSIGAAALSRSLFPVGGMQKSQTRDVARSLALRTAETPESYDICFVPDGDVAAFVGASASFEPGPILDTAGATVGTHQGIHNFTVGQRRGLGLSTHERRFVLEVDPARNAIVVGEGELLSRRGIVAEKVVWFDDAPPAGSVVTVQIRAHGTPIPAVVEDYVGGAASVRLDRPERGIAAGQLIAFYDGTRVLGGGTIVSASA